MALCMYRIEPLFCWGAQARQSWWACGGVMCLVLITTVGGALLHISRSKTDQAGRGTLVFIRPCAHEVSMCPVASSKRLRSLVSTSDGPIFTGRAG